MREALLLLAAAGLVDHQSHARAIVAQPDADTLEGMFMVMGHLEALCAGLAALKMDASERGALEALHMEMAAFVRQGDSELYARHNEAFHGAIYEGAHNPYLAEITRATRLRLRPFRHAQFATLGRLTRSHAEHDAIVEAILRGDGATAREAMSRHIALVEGSFNALLAAKS